MPSIEMVMELRAEIERLRAAQARLFDIIDQNCHRGIVATARSVIEQTIVKEK